MKEIYDQFKCRDFILDDDFRAWVHGDRPEDSDAWDKWLAAHPASRREVERGVSIVRALKIEEKVPTPEMIDSEWKKLQEKVAILESNSSNQSESPRTNRGLFSWFNLLVAASLLTVGLLSGRFIFNRIQLKANSELLSISTKNGKQKHLTLPDGTIVKLNAGSTLSYPVSFSKSQREVTLVGEAYFKVAKNPNAPFIIHTGELDTKVIGTEFNINAYPETGTVQVAVIEGKVRVNNVMVDHKPGVFLTQKEMVTFSKEDKELVVSSFDENDQIGWKDGLVYFEKSDFQTVIYKLERWYGVHIQISNNKVKLNEPTWRFSGSFKDKTLNEILDVISYPNKFSYKIDNGIVTLY